MTVMRRPARILVALALLGPDRGVRAEEGPDAAEIARLKAEMALHEEVATAVSRGTAWMPRRRMDAGTRCRLPRGPSRTIPRRP